MVQFSNDDPRFQVPTKSVNDPNSGGRAQRDAPQHVFENALLLFLVQIAQCRHTEKRAERHEWQSREYTSYSIRHAPMRCRRQKDRQREREQDDFNRAAQDCAIDRLPRENAAISRSKMDLEQQEMCERNQKQTS